MEHALEKKPCRWNTFSFNYAPATELLILKELLIISFDAIEIGLKFLFYCPKGLQLNI